MHILRIANFVSPTSGGIKTALRHWGQVYREQGHQVSLIIPGPGPETEETEQGTVYRLPAVPIPGQGYSVMVNPRAMARLVQRIAPDTIEVSDRLTTRWLGSWARARGIGSMMISHENVTGILQRRTPLPARLGMGVADRLNRASARDYDMIVCPSEFAADEFHRFGAADVHVVPLGVDLDTFRPAADHVTLTPDGRPREDSVLQIIHCGRLAPEKNPSLSLETMRTLHADGVRAHLTVLGHGPLRNRLMDASENLPVTFHSYISDRDTLAQVMARANVAIAPGPVETFGLAALEALACGVPTVCPDEGALQEVVGDAGIAAPSHPRDFADAVRTLASLGSARTAARAQAETFNWRTSAARMLELHAQLSRH